MIQLHPKTLQMPAVAKVIQPQAVFREMLMGQLIDKAKLTLSNGKNEMEMHLKPEHLGKISMKIVSENGTVMAKILAESEQAKAIIETNMDSFKNSLESQGIKVQGFSVSLGQQDKPKGFEQPQGSKNEKEI